VNHADLALGLGISRSNATKLVARGMPTDSIEAARAWRRANVALRMPAAKRVSAAAEIRALAEQWKVQRDPAALEQLRERVTAANAAGESYKLPVSAWDALVGDRL
jgi:hypothetical protein